MIFIFFFHRFLQNLICFFCRDGDDAISIGTDNISRPYNDIGAYDGFLDLSQIIGSRYFWDSSSGKYRKRPFTYGQAVTDTAVDDNACNTLFLRNFSDNFSQECYVCRSLGCYDQNRAFRGFLKSFENDSTVIFIICTV